jgi:hypothetical protein
MRDHARVARKQLRTSNYSPDDRRRLGEAVEAARIAAGYKYRTDFCRANDIKSVRSMELLENGKTGVGQAFLFEVADALPGWTHATPRLILEGHPAPPPLRETVDDDLPRVPAVASLDANLPFDQWPPELQERYAYLDEKVRGIGIPYLTPRLLRVAVDHGQLLDWLDQAPVREGTFSRDDRQ